ncbi:MAG TPA: dihydrolipoamide acetyltransferase family protein [Acidimicrobiales bacterium]|nr:dihydrolipoamide acetyltransferase family protein [Acidimicrobiales bacterium]
MGEFRMPSLGADMDAGSILEWRVQPGDVVHRGDIVAVVDTDKSDIEVEVFEDGVVEELLVEPGVEVAVGTPLARLAPLAGRAAEAGPAGEETAKPKAVARRKGTGKAKAVAGRKETGKAKAVRKPKEAAPVGASAAAPVEPSERKSGGFVRASPRARRLAAQEGVELDEVVGTGPGGAVRAEDLEAGAVGAVPAGAPEPTAAAPTRDRRDAMRRAIADLMARSAREIPHYYLGTDVDLQAATGWLGEVNAARPVHERLLPAALLLKATAVAATQVRELNGFYDDGFRPSPDVHLGVAISLRGGGLVAPAIHHADQLTLGDLMAALRDLVERARAGRLRSSEMSDPTLTVTNLGDQGVEEVLGVIYPPQVALVGFGRVLERPVAVDGMLTVHPVVRATLSADHRVTDGHTGAAFLTAVDRLLQTPEEL